MTKRRDALMTKKLDALSDLLHSIQDDHYPTELDKVQALRMIRETAESALDQAVPAAIDAGETWAQVGRALAISPQGAHQHYAAC